LLPPPFDDSDASPAVYLNAYADARSALAVGRYEDVQDIVARLDNLQGEEHLKSHVLFRTRLLRVDALFASGRGREVLRALDVLEAQYGASWDTLMRRARLGLYTAEYEDALAALDKAMLSMPHVAKDNHGPLREAAMLKVDLLVQSGQSRRAREFFLHILNPSVHALTDRELAALRKTIDDHEALAEFKELLLGFIAHRARRTVNALFNYSIAARDLDHYDEALWAIRHRFIVGVKALKFGDRPGKPREDWSEAARRALLDLREDLAAANIQFFLISGTLLGCIRQGGILGHDKDIDVGVMADVPFEALRSALWGTGRFMLLPVITQRILRIKHANGVMIDVFFHWHENGRLYHEGQKTRWWNTPFELVEREFLGERFLVPENAELYLTENYGDWRTPVKDFETFCDTPNMEVAERNELLWYYYKALLDHFHSGRVRQFEKVWERLQALDRPSLEVHLAVEHARKKIEKSGKSPRR